MVSAKRNSRKGRESDNGNGGRKRNKSGNKKTYIPSYVQEGEKCVVCGDNSTGTHYRAMTCEGCKGFFRRTIQKSKGEEPGLVCKKEGRCEMTPTTRNTCQCCRFQKCLAMKMDPNSVLSEPQRAKLQNLIGINKIEKERKMNAAIKKDEWDGLRRMAKIYYVMRFVEYFNSHVLKNPEEKQKALKTPPEECNTLSSGAQHVVKFALSVPGIETISRNDLRVLLRRNMTNVLCVMMVELFNPQENAICFSDFRLLQSDLEKHPEMERIFKFATRMSIFRRPDGIFLACLSAILLLDCFDVAKTGEETTEKDEFHLENKNAVFELLESFWVIIDKYMTQERGTCRGTVFNGLMMFEDIRQIDINILSRICMTGRYPDHVIFPPDRQETGNHIGGNPGRELNAAIAGPSNALPVEDVTQDAEVENLCKTSVMQEQQLISNGEMAGNGQISLPGGCNYRLADNPMSTDPVKPDGREARHIAPWSSHYPTTTDGHIPRAPWYDNGLTQAPGPRLISAASYVSPPSVIRQSSTTDTRNSPVHAIFRRSPYPHLNNSRRSPGLGNNHRVSPSTSQGNPTWRLSVSTMQDASGHQNRQTVSPSWNRAVHRISPIPYPLLSRVISLPPYEPSRSPLSPPESEQSRVMSQPRQGGGDRPPNDSHFTKFEDMRSQYFPEMSRSHHESREYSEGIYTVPRSTTEEHARPFDPPLDLTTEKTEDLETLRKRNANLLKMMRIMCSNTNLKEAVRNRLLSSGSDSLNDDNFLENFANKILNPPSSHSEEPLICVPDSRFSVLFHPVVSQALTTPHLSYSHSYEHHQPCDTRPLRPESCGMTSYTPNSTPDSQHAPSESSSQTIISDHELDVCMGQSVSYRAPGHQFTSGYSSHYSIGDKIPGNDDYSECHPGNMSFTSHITAHNIASQSTPPSQLLSCAPTMDQGQASACRDKFTDGHSRKRTRIKAANTSDASSAVSLKKKWLRDFQDHC